MCAGFLLGIAMLRNLKMVLGCKVLARDGEVGTVEQVYFDDENWGVRYLVVETGSWLHDRRVLISPYAVQHTDPGTSDVHVNLTRQQVRDSPDIDTQKPVSRQQESKYLRYYGYPTYWGGPNLWGMGAYPAFDGSPQQSTLPFLAHPRKDPDAEQVALDIHLRSSQAVIGYLIETIDGRSGHVSGFVFDDEAWVIRYLIVDIHNWLPRAKEVLLATQWVYKINWLDSMVSTTLTSNAIKNSPIYDDSVPVDRHYEVVLHEFHARDGYWARSSLPITRNSRLS